MKKVQEGGGTEVDQGEGWWASRAGAGGQGGAGRTSGPGKRIGEADNHLNPTDIPPNDTIMTAKKSTKSLITASSAATRWTDNYAIVSLTNTGQADSSTVSLAVTEQTESSGVGVTTQR